MLLLMAIAQWQLTFRLWAQLKGVSPLLLTIFTEAPCSRRTVTMDASKTGPGQPHSATMPLITIHAQSITTIAVLQALCLTRALYLTSYSLQELYSSIPDNALQAIPYKSSIALYLTRLHSSFKIDF